LGNPTGFHRTGGQTHALASADVLLEGIEASALLAARAYDADERVRFFGPSADRKRLEKDQCSAVIPSKANRKVPYPDDKYLYKARHLIENFFAKLKQYRGIATRYDKTASNLLGAIYLAATVIWLN
ncbi:MAG: transposase, partial [Hormoscilla sp. GM102CHS1]|nr:transposase [Hormoscilla sp. GM102CHS1]